MKRTLVWVVISAALVIAMVGCNQPSSSSYPFEGTWYAGLPGLDDLNISFTSFSVSGSLGSVACSIQAIDTSANHIQMSVTTAGSGIYVAWISGATIYVTYGVSGNQLNFWVGIDRVPFIRLGKRTIYKGIAWTEHLPSQLECASC